MSREEFLSALKCIRFGSLEDLKFYHHKDRIINWQTKDRYIVNQSRTWNQEFPVCDDCFEKFKHWKEIDIFFRTIKLLLLFSFMIIILVDLITHHDSPVLVLIQFITVLILLIIGLYFHRKQKKSKENPFYYMTSRFGGRVRPENLGKWIPFAEWVAFALKERISLGNINPTFQENIITYLMNYENKKSTYLHKKQTTAQTSDINEQELMDKAYNFLKRNSGKAFTLEAILNRISDNKFDNIN